MRVGWRSHSLETLARDRFSNVRDASCRIWGLPPLRLNLRLLTEHKNTNTLNQVPGVNYVTAEFIPIGSIVVPF